MTTSQKISLASELESHLPLSEKTKAYFRERIRNQFYNLVAQEYIRERDTNSLTQAHVARRLGRSPVQINRWLGTPGNWTLDTISDLLLAISGSELHPTCSKVQVASKRNDLGPEWLQPHRTNGDSTDNGTAVGQTVIVIPDIEPKSLSFKSFNLNGSITPFGKIEPPQIEVSVDGRFRAPTPASSLVEA
jgi:hypothetical protein